jgi:hypothetical protein
MKRTSICKVFILASLGVTLAACAWDGKGRYQVVQVSYDYDNKDQSAHEWRAFMDALDRCHLAGYQDAQLASQSQRQCKAGGEGNCSQFEVTRKYDCFGLGYQTSS